MTPHESPSVTRRPDNVKIAERPEEWSEKSMLDAWVSNNDFNRKREPQIRASGVVEKEIRPGYGNMVSNTKTASAQSARRVAMEK